MPDIWGQSGAPQWMDPTKRHALLTQEGTQLAQGFMQGFGQSFGRSQAHSLFLEDQQRIASKLQPIASAFTANAPLAQDPASAVTHENPNQYNLPIGPGEPNGESNPLPAPGVIIDGWKFQGGDPADPNNWQKVN